MAVRQFKKPRVKRVKPPRPVPPPVPPRPRRSVLKSIYKHLISSSVDQRLEALKKACHWYDVLQAYLAYERERSVAQKQYMDAAIKARLEAINTSKSEHKEKHFVEAIQNYEKMTRRYKAPKIGAFLSKYSHLRHELDGRKRKYANKFQEFLAIVDDALRPVNYEGTRIVMHVDKLLSNYRIDSEGNVTFDRKFVEQAKRIARKQGLLPGLESLLPVLSEAAAQTVEVDAEGYRTGRFVVHGSRRHKALLDMISSFIQYVQKD